MLISTENLLCPDSKERGLVANPQSQPEPANSSVPLLVNHTLTLENNHLAVLQFLLHS